jgi:hypothetical protein
MKDCCSRADHDALICELSLLQAPKPSSGPHKSRKCLPLILILRNRLKYVLIRALSTSSGTNCYGEILAFSLFLGYKLLLSRGVASVLWLGVQFDRKQFWFEPQL